MHRLFVVFNRIGDLTLQIPLFRLLAQTGELSILTRPFGKPLLKNQSYIKDVIPLAHPTWGKFAPFRPLVNVYRKPVKAALTQHHFDEIIVYDNERPQLVKWLSRCFPTAKIRVAQAPKNHKTHVSDYYRYVANSLDLDLNAYDEIPALELSDEKIAHAKALLQPLGSDFIGVQMGSQRTDVFKPFKKAFNVKGLSDTQWLNLLTEVLQSEPQTQLLFHGSPRESSLIEQCIAQLPEALRVRCHNFSSSVPIDLLPALLAEQRAMISVDTGPAHIAAAVACPLLVFFGPSDSTVYRMLSHAPVEVIQGDAPCMPCMHLDYKQFKRCRDNICLNRLEPDVFSDAWQRLAGSL